MTNGQQQGEQNLATFIAWSVNKTDAEFKELVHRGKLKRKDIADECGFGKSALVQNPDIKDALKGLEDGLRTRGVLPQLKEDSNNNAPPLRDKEATQRRRDSQRLNALEAQNASLRAELETAKAMLKKYHHLREFLSETGRLPR